MEKSALVTVPCLMLLLLLLLPCASSADPGNDYCIKPPFISSGVEPNLLLMIDNSASMNDLAHVDQGLKHCSGSATICVADADCASGQTCSVFDRQPFYCYDKSYISATPYYGYFEREKFYYYRPATDDFVPAAGATLATVVSTAPSVCGAGATNVTKSIPNTMCLEYSPGASKTLVKFVAKGNYLNWLTASKIDTEKQALTGGDFDGTNLIPQSRGCVGQGFVKDANTADFINFTDNSAVDPNVPLQVTYTISGPGNPYNPTAPSPGGQTYINLFGGADFDYGACQQAIKDLSTGGNADIKQSVGDCLQSAGTPTGVCSHVPAGLPAMSCGINSDCLLSSSKASTAYVCKTNLSQTCSGPIDTSCEVAARNSCSLDPTYACSNDAGCTVTTAAVSGTCSTSRAKYSPKPGGSWALPGNSCTSDAACDFAHGSTTFTAQAGACVDYVPASTVNKGTCVATAAANYGPCTPNYVGDCVVTAQAAAVKTSVSFQQSMQECWTIRGETHSAADNYGFSNMNTVKNQCPDIFASYKTCHDNHLKQCSSNADCAADGTVTCDSGPDAIAAGNPALLCGTNYTGQYFEKNSVGNWVLKSAATDLQLAEAQYRFCTDIQASTVTDPTDAPSDSATTDNLPAIVSGVGVQAQLGLPIAKMRAKVAVSAAACTADADCPDFNACKGGICQPSGLVQQFGTQMRMGAMSFNQVGSASETALPGVKVPKVCSNAPTLSCTQDIDCGTGDCEEAANADGGSIRYPIGKGYCATMTTTPCNADSDCTASGASCISKYCGTLSSTVCTTALTCSGTQQACVRHGVGEYSTADSLVRLINQDIRTNAWTPFAETFYSALGYFAAIPQASGSFKGRVTGAGTGVTNLRLNASDFVETQHPSEYRCQQNYILLVTDGGSAADRNSTASSLASLYASQAGATAGNCAVATGSVDYGGSSNLPVLSWIGKRHNLASFSTSAVTPLRCSAHTTTVCAADSDCPSGETCSNARNPRDFVTTFVVLNGADSGAAGPCNVSTMLKKTATNGGTNLLQAKNPQELTQALTDVFQTIAGKASSGTAASILSNSEGSGANILQAVFYPKKIFDHQTSTTWIGEMQNLWYFVDPLISHSTIREDSDADHSLNLLSDHVVNFRFDSADNSTYAYTSSDTNGDGLGDTVEVKKDSDLVKSIWRAGKQLYLRDLTVAPRIIYTSLLPGGTEKESTGLMPFSYGAIGSTTFPDNSTVLQPYLQMSDNAGAVKLMKYVHGFDFPADPLMRNRTVQIGSVPHATVGSATYLSNPRDKGIGVWKLGDIISSTPRIQSTGRLNSYGLPAPSGYADASYNSFIASSNYLSRGMVYVGANDGMLHAFKLGQLDVTASGSVKAHLSGTGLGEEQWAFIPKHTLPYLKYQSDPDYNHLYYIDGPTLVLDASIGNIAGCTKDTYYDCVKNPSVVNGSNQVDAAKNTWMTVVIGSAGLGGASSKSCTTGSNCVQTPRTDPADATKGLGYSSYFALNVTDPEHPSLLWEFSHPELGYASSGPAIVRVGEPHKNGRWFAVFGSGPTGPIDTDTHQFMGRSDQPLKFFVVDLRTGALVGDPITSETAIANAFAGSMIGGAIDADRWNKNAAGNYQDDAVYVGYTKKTGTTWTDGGVLRILTKESADPANWVVSPLIADIGPVTNAISRLQDKKNKNLWLYFGTGRYYHRAGAVIDDYDTPRTIYGIKDPCYNSAGNLGNLLDKNCEADPVTTGIADQSTAINTVGSGGWKIDLSESTDDFGAERVVTDAVALTNGALFLTSFMPTADPCGFGGNSYLWGLDYKSGDRPPDAALSGKALIQLSTGEFKDIDLSTAFGAGSARLMRRTSVPMTGKPPADAFPIVSKSANKPVKRILHIQER